MNFKFNSIIDKIEIPSNPENPNWHEAESYYRKGKKFERLGHINLAIKSYTDAIQLNQWNADAYYRRALLNKEGVDIKKALLDLQKASDLYSAQFNFGQYQKVQILFRQFQQLHFLSTHKVPKQSSATNNISSDMLPLAC